MIERRPRPFPQTAGSPQLALSRLRWSGGEADPLG